MLEQEYENEYENVMTIDDICAMHGKLGHLTLSFPEGWREEPASVAVVRLAKGITMDEVEDETDSVLVLMNDLYLLHEAATKYVAAFPDKEKESLFCIIVSTDTIDEDIRELAKRFSSVRAWANDMHHNFALLIETDDVNSDLDLECHIERSENGIILW